MIITQTPLRISFFGGGTDFREYFLQEEGWVISTTINKYIRVIINKRFNDQVRVGYTRTELVDHIDDIQHELVRECLRKTGLTKGVEIFTIGDVPSDGSGLSSSSTVTVGLLNAIYTYLGTPQSKEVLARQACEVEIDMIGKPIGVQDQYIVAYGGQRFLHFQRDGEVKVQPLGLDEEARRVLGEHMMLFFTRMTRKSEMVLEEQVSNIDHRMAILKEMKDLTLEARTHLLSGNFNRFGRLLDKGWHLKKQMASRISNPEINAMYDAALDAGAFGGKISGAGGGGFLLLYCPKSFQDDVRAALRHLPELHFSFEQHGTRVIFDDR